MFSQARNPKAARSSLAASSKLRILVLGYIVRGPLGGLAWHHLQYVKGLAELGHDVYFLEDSGDSGWCCYDPTRHVSDTNPAYGLSFARNCFDRLGLPDRWSYYDAHGAGWTGPSAGKALELCATADVLLNVSAVNPLRPWFEKIQHRALVDTDPVFTQIRHLSDVAAREGANRHTCFFSYAANIGRAGCTVPDDGLRWIATRQPVVLSAWPVTRGLESAPFTTVMQWDSYAERTYGGKRYGMKSSSFGEYADLPARTGATFEIAMGKAPDHLAAAGWTVCNPLETMPDPWAYQRYIQRSKAEWSVAKHGYVVSRSGWFSERSAAYLASGRPVVVQDTGFSDWLPTGEGVFSFATPRQAIAGIEEVSAKYGHQCARAREIAHEYFDSGDVLNALLSSVAASAEAPKAPHDLSAPVDNERHHAGT